MARVTIALVMLPHSRTELSTLPFGYVEKERHWNKSMVPSIASSIHDTGSIFVSSSAGTNWIHYHFRVVARASVVAFVYGGAISNKPDPVDIIKHCCQNNITKLWISKAEFDVLDELLNSQIKVIIPVENTEFKSFAIDPSQASSWVKNYVFDYWPSIEFQYICVGQEALQTGDSDSLLAAMRNINNVIQLEPNTKDKIMIPLFVNIFPYTDYVKSANNLDLSHYLFTATSTLVIDPKGNYKYKSVFDSMVDGFYAGIDNLGVRDVKLIVAGTGWPYHGCEVQQEFGCSCEERDSQVAEAS
ncbi:glucan endo-1,3-beta-glucosidase-like [Tasmannia lanceolata]|uniref:glucan endo-1,3-beta-glucosidase-like n=1 Tax=Tasmannia lanceolata TaxID=3420 RepID=UPI0040644DD0